MKYPPKRLSKRACANSSSPEWTQWIGDRCRILLELVCSSSRNRDLSSTMPMPLSPACRARRPLNGSNGHPESHMNRSISYNGHSLGIPSNENGNSNHAEDGPLNPDERIMHRSVSQNGTSMDRTVNPESPVNESSSHNGDSINGSSDDHESRFRQKTPISAVFAEHLSLRYVGCATIEYLSED